MNIGYARVSTHNQNYSMEHQIEALKAYGCTEIFSEKVSSTRKRDALDNMLTFCRRGDTIACVALDRLARSTKELIRITDILEEKGVSLVILNLSINTAEPQGKLMLSLLSAVANFELNLIKERQSIGLQKAKEKGVRLGRFPSVSSRKSEIQELYNSGLKVKDIAEKLQVSVPSVYRVVSTFKPVEEKAA